MTQLTLGRSASGESVQISEVNFGDVAMARIKQYMDNAPVNRRGEKETITTSKIRNILEMTNNIYNNVFYLTGDELPNGILSDIAYLKIKMAYESGREKTVEDFVKRSCLMNPISEIIKSKRKDVLLLYCRYVESLVAYFKFYGGRD